MVRGPVEEEKKQEEQKYEIIRFTVRPQPKVNFAAGTVDNEGMNKKKSKLCCIYNGGHKLESSSSSGEEEHDCTGGHEHNRYDRYPKHQRRAMREMAKKEKDAQNKEEGD